MEVAPELRIAAAHAPAFDHLVEVLAALRRLQGADEGLGIRRRQIEHEVRVAGQHARVDRQGVQARLVAQRLAEHEGDIAVRAVAQHGIDLALAAGRTYPQHGRLGEALDDLEAGRRPAHQATEGLLGVLQFAVDARSIAVAVQAAVDRVGTRIEVAVATQQFFGEGLLRLLLRQSQRARRVVVEGLVVHPHLQLAAVLVPVVEQRLARVDRHQAEEVLLGAVADQVEVQPRLRLVRDVAEDIEVHHQPVVGSLEQRVVHQPQGLRYLAKQALAHRGAVELAEDAQQGVVVAVPDRVPGRRRRVGVDVLAQVFVLVALVPVGAPQAEQVLQLVDLPRQGQQRLALRAEVGVGDEQVLLGVLEYHPEVVADHVGGDLSTAHRPADEGTGEVFGVVQHELVARPWRDRGEGGERVGTALHAVAGNLVGVPLGAEEQLLDAFQLLRRQRIGDVRLVYDHALDRPEAVIEAVARIVVGTPGRDRVDRLAAGRARTHQLEEVAGRALLREIQVRQEQVLVEPARDQALLGPRLVEETLPAGHLARLGGGRPQRLLVDRGARGQPLLQGGVFVVAQPGHRERHAGTWVLADERIDAGRRRALVGAVDRNVQAFGDLRIRLQRLAVAKLEHPRHQCGLAVLRFEHRPEVLAPPGVGTVRIEVQAGGFLRLGPRAVVDRQLVGAALRALGAAQVELAGRVVAGVAGDALGGKDRLDVTAIGNFSSGNRLDKRRQNEGQPNQRSWQHEPLLTRRRAILANPPLCAALSQRRANSPRA
ncbi:Uncharacterised protein [Klebsiella pneumoniae]|nr:Uncharacterised protein [Klebsiella pneumoniae]